MYILAVCKNLALCSGNKPELAAYHKLNAMPANPTYSEPSVLPKKFRHIIAHEFYSVSQAEKSWVGTAHHPGHKIAEMKESWKI